MKITNGQNGSIPTGIAGEASEIILNGNGLERIVCAVKSEPSGPDPDPMEVSRQMADNYGRSVDPVDKLPG